MNKERMANILADHLATVPGLPEHLIEEVRRGPHSPNIAAAIQAIAFAVTEATVALQAAAREAAEAVQEAIRGTP